MANLLAVMYGHVLQVRPTELPWPARDRFILSKGHCTAILYAVLAERGFFPLDELLQYGTDGSRLLAHVSHHVPGVEFSTGSLGHGLAFACGKALAAKRQQQSWRTFVMLSDGELDEGSNWEAILFGGHHRLGRLTAVVDYNQIQSLGNVSDVLELNPLADKFRSFRWDMCEIDGHDIQQIQDTLTGDRCIDARPLVVIAHTVKGKVVDFMEHQLKYHYSPPRTAEQVEDVVRQLESADR